MDREAFSKQAVEAIAAIAAILGGIKLAVARVKKPFKVTAAGVHDRLLLLSFG
jgi:hypothetical protein